MTNSSDSCEHKELDKSVCIECGKCIETLELCDSFTETNKFIPNSQMKYLIKDPMKKDLTAIKKILIPLNLENYLYPVRDLIMKTEFKAKLKIEDKAILSILHLSKANSFPLSLQDLLKFTTMNKFRILKVSRDTFDYLENTKEYMRGLFERTVDLLLKNNLKNEIDTDFEDFFQIFEKLKNTDPKLLCLAYFFEKNRIPSTKIKDISDYKIAQIQYARTKLKKVKDEMKN